MHGRRGRRARPLDRGAGARGLGGYTVDEAASRHGASVDEDTAVPKEAYAQFMPSKVTSYPDGLLPES